MKKIVALTIAALSTCMYSCSEPKNEYAEKRKAAEAEGQICLEKARTALEGKDYATARNTIEEMRKTHSLALNAREEGILLLDSINLSEAEAQLKKVSATLKDSVNIDKEKVQIEFDDLFQKTKFYKRKLEHDRKERKTH